MSTQPASTPFYIYKYNILLGFSIAETQFITFCIKWNTLGQKCKRNRAPDFCQFCINFLDYNVKSINPQGGRRVQSLNRLFITALFGAIIFVVNAFLPPPINYVLIVVQAVLLALSGLFIKSLGATYVGAVGGLLTALGSPALGPFTFLFSFLFGALTDCSLRLFRINATSSGVNRNRLMIAMGLATMLIGIISYSAFALFPQFVPLAKEFSSLGLFIQRSTILIDMLVLFMGPATGIVAGYAAAYLGTSTCDTSVFKSQAV